jgi:predicted LPLAT superfamily acyltransferase
MTDQGQGANWTQQKERGSVFLMRLMAWISLHLGRRVARLVLHPISLYFLLFAPTARRVSRTYLGRALGRAVTWRDHYRHIHTFASTILDRIFLLNEQFDLFDLRFYQDDLLMEASASGEGRLMLGAHMGSFESVRAHGHSTPGAPPVALLMYEANAQKLSQLMTAVNSAASQEIIALGGVDTMLQVRTRLDEGACCGMLADRTFQKAEVTWLPFLGQPAPFPAGAFRLAALIRRPLLLMLGIYRGGNRYDIHFELLFDFSQPGLKRGEAVQQAQAQYASRLEHYCRAYPYNWFNFYDFWRFDHVPR